MHILNVKLNKEFISELMTTKLLFLEMHSTFPNLLNQDKKMCQLA